MVAINKPEDEDFYWYFLNKGISSKNEDKYSDKEYIWSDEKLESFECEADIDKFLENVRNGKAKYFKIKKGLFSRREKLVYDNYWDEHESWYIDDIKRVDVWFSYTKEDMTMSEAEERLDVEEYAKMMKSLGLKGE
jgi:hypothetical protein